MNRRALKKTFKNKIRKKVVINLILSYQFSQKNKLTKKFKCFYFIFHN